MARRILSSWWLAATLALALALVVALQRHSAQAIGEKPASMGAMLSPLDSVRIGKETPPEKVLKLAGLKYLGKHVTHMLMPNYVTHDNSNRHYYYSRDLGAWSATGITYTNALSEPLAASGIVSPADVFRVDHDFSSVRAIVWVGSTSTQVQQDDQQKFICGVSDESLSNAFFASEINGHFRLLKCVNGEYPEVDFASVLAANTPHVIAISVHGASFNGAYTPFSTSVDDLPASMTSLHLDGWSIFYRNTTGPMSVQLVMLFDVDLTPAQHASFNAAFAAQLASGL